MALPENPITRNEQYLSSIAGEGTELPDYPITRKEKYLAAIAGENVVLPEYPIDREEKYLAYIAENGGGGDITLVELQADENKVYTPDTGEAYKKVTVSVPIPASQEELDGIAGLVGGIETPSTPADIEAQAGDLIDDANAATGESAETLTAAVASLIAGQGGEVVYFSSSGSMYTENVVYPDNVTTILNTIYGKATNMKSIKANGVITADTAPFVNSTSATTHSHNITSIDFPNLEEISYRFLWGLSAVKNINLPKLRVFNHSTGARGTNADTMIFGSIGHPFEKMHSNAFGNCTADTELTIYVDANSIAEISPDITNGQPWGDSNLTIVYRNAMTGEVLT